MIRWITRVLVIAGVCFFTSTPAFASTPVDELVIALSQSRVYVEPGTPQTDSDTQGILTNQLKNDDHLLIVMLSGKEPMSESQLSALAREIDDVMGNGYIVAVSSGDVIVAHSDILPSGEATELMRRAISVSTNTPETMTTFIRNTHNFLNRNPELIVEVEVQRSAAANDSSSAPVIIGGSATIVVVAIATAIFGSRQRKKRRQAMSDGGLLEFKYSPEMVKARIKNLLSKRQQIRDHNLVSLIEDIAIDVEAYFARNTTRDGKVLRERDAKQMSIHLDSIEKVLDRYIDVQTYPRYYDSSVSAINVHLTDGYKAVQGFAEYVLSNIRRSTRQALTDYRVDTKILQAQRYG